jgi:hypothetical protein
MKKEEMDRQLVAVEKMRDNLLVLLDKEKVHASVGVSACLSVALAVLVNSNFSKEEVTKHMLAAIDLVYADNNDDDEAVIH